MAEIEAAIHKLPVRKAALPELPPTVAWKVAAGGLAARIHQTLQQCWCQGSCRLPAAWYKSTLCLLPKPGKSPTHPKALRPISLQQPICKILDGLAVERAQQEKPALLCQLPCFAYIKHRSAEDCLLKASAHCKAVQSLLKQAPYAPHLPKPSLRGGLQLCVDLSQAFNRVSRQLVESSVRSAGYSAEVETALLIWLHGGTFQIEHKGQTAQVPCSRGVKQGSRGGPHMWSLVTRYVLLKLASSRGADGIAWIQSHILNYADDYHGSWVGHSEISMHQAVREAAEFLSALEDAGLQLNLQKSAAMLKVVGPKERAFYKNYVMRRADGVFLKCSTRSGKTYHVPLVKKWDYLGATLSYAAHAADTVSRRVRAADHAFSKLKQVLGARRSLPIHQRLAVYDACVQSTLVYAVFATGIGASEARLIHYMMMRHLRYIAQSPRHITRESNEQLCQRLGRPLPLATLHHVWEKKCRAWKQRRKVLSPQDLVLSVPPYPDLLAALNRDGVSIDANVAMPDMPQSLCHGQGPADTVCQGSQHCGCAGGRTVHLPAYQGCQAWHLGLRALPCHVSQVCQPCVPY